MFGMVCFKLFEEVEFSHNYEMLSFGNAKTNKIYQYF